MLPNTSRRLGILTLGMWLLASSSGLTQDDKEKSTAPEGKDEKKTAPFDKEALPDLNELFKGMPLDPKQAAQLKKAIQGMMEEYRKSMGKGGAFPPGAFPGGGFPGGGFPGGGFPGFPGGPFPGGGFPGGPFPGGPDRGPSDGRLGVLIEVPPDVLVDQLGLKDDQGLVIINVRPDSPAAKGGLKANDILLEWDGKPVPNDPGRFKEMVDRAGKDPVGVKVLRKGKEETLKEVTLPERKAEPRKKPRIDVFLLPPVPPHLSHGKWHPA